MEQEHRPSSCFCCGPTAEELEEQADMGGNGEGGEATTVKIYLRIPAVQS